MGQTIRAAIDIGNTRIKCGVFEGHELIDLLATEDETVLDSFLQDKEISSAIISDVRGTNIPNQLRSKLSAIIMNDKLKLPIHNNYASPETLGTDRIAAAVGANILYNTKTIFVIDAGTCITTGFVQDHIYIGGSISPGIHMRYRALHEFTGKLPYIESTTFENIKSIGLDTTDSIHSGVLAGAIYEVESRLKAILDAEKVEQPYTIVTTGGDGPFLAEQLKYRNFANENEITFEPNLVLIGLNEILLLNESEIS